MARQLYVMMPTIPSDVKTKLAECASLLENLSNRTDTLVQEPDKGKLLRGLASGTVKTHACYYTHSGVGGQWSVGLSLGGQFCELGRIRGRSDVPAVTQTELACRFADMARLYFWKYKIRGASKPPVDSDFNFSLAQAKKDLEWESELMELLKEEEKILIAAEVIRLPGDNVTLDKRARPTDQLNSRVSSLQLKLHEVERHLNTLSTNMEGMREFQSQLVGLLQGILYRLNEMQSPGLIQCANPNASGVEGAQSNPVATPESPVLSCSP